METEIKLKTKAINDGTFWTVLLNGTPLKPRFKQKDAALVAEKLLNGWLPQIAEEISKEMEK